MVLFCQCPSRWIVKENWTWGDMTIKDGWGNAVFQAKEMIFTFGHQLEFIDLRTGREIGFIKQHLKFIGMPKFSIFVGGTLIAEMKQNFTWFSQRFEINMLNGGPPIVVSGDWTAHSYTFRSGHRLIAKVGKELLTFRDTYYVEVQPGENVILILACCIIIDKCKTKT